MVNKSNLSEEDVKERYITPAIREKGWNPTDYRMEYEYTDGRITVLKMVLNEVNVKRSITS